MIKKKIGSLLRKFITNSSWYNKQFLDCKKFWQLKTFSNEVAFIGSDNGHYSCNFKQINKPCVDLTLRDSTILQIYEVLKNYSSYLKEGDCQVVMIISPFDFLTGSTTYFEDRYYTVLNLCSIPAFSYERRAEVMARRNNPLLYYPLFSLRKDIPALFKKKDDTCRTTTQQYIEHIKSRYSIRELSAKFTMLNQDAFDDSFVTLSKISDFCKDHGFSFRLVFPPVPSPFSKELSQFMSNSSFIDLISKIKSIGIDVRDLSFDSTFSVESNDFSSDLYLSEKGASRFTKIILQ